MQYYEQIAKEELQHWQRQMRRKPSILNRISKGMQNKINNIIPEKIHQAITATIKEMVKAVLFGARHTSAVPLADASLQMRETKVKDKIDLYRKTAAVEGALTGAGGFFLGLADFPLLLGVKLKLLFEIASLYGHDVDDYKERLFILQIFQLAFSSQEHRRNIFNEIQDWDTKVSSLPSDINEFEWRNFQQEYRDYIDLAKMAQLVPVIGAPVGLVVNYRLVKKLGDTAMNAYRMRWYANQSHPISTR